MRNDYTPKKLFELLSETVKGQDDFLKKLSNVVWLHNKRIEARSKGSNKTCLQKYNLLCVGPTGSGKTLAVTTLAKLYGFDVGIFNAVDFTGTGWKGRDVAEIIQELFILCDKNKSRTEHAIVVLDEFDKMILQNSDREPSYGAENSLLKLIEGMNVIVKDGDQSEKIIDTKDILFIAAGAFEGIDKIVLKRLGGEKTIGFNSVSTTILIDDDNIYELVIKDDLLEYGMGTQLLGRFTDLTYLRKLGVAELEEILMNSDSSAVSCMDNLLGVTCGIEVEIDKNGAHVVAEKAFGEKTGARGLSQIILPALHEIIFNMDVTGKKQKILITADENKNLDVKIKDVYSSVKKSNIVKNIPIECRPQKNTVECFADYIMSACPDISYATIREMRAAHALLCSLIFYLLLECNKEDQTIEGLKKLMDVAIPPKEPGMGNRPIAEVLMFESRGSMDYNFYYDKFRYLDETYRSAELARKALEVFSINPKYEIKALYGQF